jgi:AcrR family transcriptional regulator
METRERILKAAALIFKRYGFRQANMELVAAEAAMSRQGVYRHFSSKDALFVETAEELQRSTIELAQSEAAKVQAARSGIDAVLVAAICGRLSQWQDFVSTSAHFAELETEHDRRCAATIKAYGQRFRDLLIEIIEAARESGDVALASKADSSAFAAELTAVTLGLNSIRPPMSPDTFRSLLTRIVSRMTTGMTR